jgi:hypothetical protein
LGDQDKWPSQGSLSYNTILQLDLFYKSKKSKLRSPYKFSFISDWLHNYYLDTQKLAILCKPEDKHGKEDQKSPISMTRPTPTAAPSPSKPPQNPKHPNGCFPLQQVMVGRGPIYVPFQLSDLRENLKHLNSCTDAQTNTFMPLSL